MAHKNINLGTTPDGSDGDDARTAFTKANENFTELYAGVGASQRSNAKLTALSDSVWAANKLIVATGPESVEMLGLTEGGRAVVSGNLGLGLTNNTSQVVDFNTQNIAGRIVTTAVGSTNGPINAIGFLEVVGTQTANRISQRFTELNGGGIGTVPRSWLRTNIDGNWSPWMLQITGTNWMPITTGVSANTLTDANMTWYVQGSTVTDLPLAMTGIVRCLFRGDVGGAALRCIQEYTPFEPANGGTRVWRRTRDETNAWSAWTRMDIGGLGNASTLTATASWDDITPNRALRVGNYGWGATSLSDKPRTALTYSTAFRSYNDPAMPSQSTFVGLHLQRETGGRALEVVGGDADNKLYWANFGSNGAALPWKEALAVGDYGVTGTVILATAAQINVLQDTTSGNYAVIGTEAAILGISPAYGGVIEHRGRPGATATQLFMSTGTSNMVMRMRCWSLAGGWTAWVPLLRQGDFGVGNAIVTANPNTALIPGTYSIRNGTNVPTDGGWYDMQVTVTNAEVTQTIYEIGGNRPLVYTRTRNGTSLNWTPWTCLTPMGTAQVWTPVTRVVGTTYTNDTGRPITLHFAVQASSASQYFTLNVSGAGGNGVSYSPMSFAAGALLSATIVIPPGATYALWTNTGNLNTGPVAVELR